MRAASAAALGLVGCVPLRAVQQVTTTHVVEQRAAVPAPAAPLAVAAPLERGQVMAMGGATYAATQGASSLGQQVVPFLGVGRIATGVSDSRFELALSGAAGPALLDIAGVEAGADGFSGVVGRGDVGFRGWTDLRNTDLEWGWTADVGAVASLYRRTDRWIVETRTGAATTVTEDVEVQPDVVRLHPDLRVGSLLRLPVPSTPAHAVLGLEVQTWPVYWGSDARSETCTTWANGLEECDRSGSLPQHASQLVGVFTPSLGAAFQAADMVVHVQGFAHLGAEDVGRVPGGVVLMIERRTPVRAPSLASADRGQ